MEVQELLRWTDEQVFAKTGQHLDSLQRSILESVLEYKNFPKIAEHNGYSYNHVKKEGAKLWKLLSDVFGENIEQRNVRSILENKAGYTIYNFVNSPQINSNNISNSRVNISRSNNHFLEDIENQFTSAKFPNQFPIMDLINAPELNYNYGRDSEISTLKSWMVDARVRLITIYGLGGIGKTALILKLISEIKKGFDYIIYRSLEPLPKLEKLKDNLNHFLAESSASPLPEIIDYFRSSRCLVILDDVQHLFKPGHLAGHYLTEYKDYRKFFQQVATSSHQSCLILSSWEKPGDIETLERENKYTKTLKLEGLGASAKDILIQNKLQDESSWDELIKRYQGHPGWLNIISATILELFGGRAAHLIQKEELFLGDIEAKLELQLERLSELEKKVVDCLAIQDEASAIFQTHANLEISKAKFWQIIQSLNRRCLLEKVATKNEPAFELNYIVKAYLAFSRFM